MEWSTLDNITIALGPSVVRFHHNNVQPVWGILANIICLSSTRRWELYPSLTTQQHNDFDARVTTVDELQKRIQNT